MGPTRDDNHVWLTKLLEDVYRVANPRKVAAAAGVAARFYPVRLDVLVRDIRVKYPGVVGTHQYQALAARVALRRSQRRADAAAREAEAAAAAGGVGDDAANRSARVAAPSEDARSVSDLLLQLEARYTPEEYQRICAACVEACAASTPTAGGGGDGCALEIETTADHRSLPDLLANLRERFPDTCEEIVALCAEGCGLGPLPLPRRGGRRSPTPPAASVPVHTESPPRALFANTNSNSNSSYPRTMTSPVPPAIAEGRDPSRSPRRAAAIDVPLPTHAFTGALHRPTSPSPLESMLSELGRELQGTRQQLHEQTASAAERDRLVAALRERVAWAEARPRQPQQQPPDAAPPTPPHPAPGGGGMHAEAHATPVGARDADAQTHANPDVDALRREVHALAQRVHGDAARRDESVQERDALVASLIAKVEDAVARAPPAPHAEDGGGGGGSTADAAHVAHLARDVQRLSQQVQDEAAARAAAREEEHEKVAEVLEHVDRAVANLGNTARQRPHDPNVDALRREVGALAAEVHAAQQKLVHRERTEEERDARIGDLIAGVEEGLVQLAAQQTAARDAARAPSPEVTALKSEVRQLSQKVDRQHQQPAVARLEADMRGLADKVEGYRYDDQRAVDALRDELLREAARAASPDVAALKQDVQHLARRMDRQQTQKPKADARTAAEVAQLQDDVARLAHHMEGRPDEEQYDALRAEVQQLAGRVDRQRVEASSPQKDPQVARLKADVARLATQLEGYRQDELHAVDALRDEVRQVMDSVDSVARDAAAQTRSPEVTALKAEVQQLAQRVERSARRVRVDDGGAAATAEMRAELQRLAGVVEGYQDDERRAVEHLRDEMRALTDNAARDAAALADARAQLAEQGQALKEYQQTVEAFVERQGHPPPPATDECTRSASALSTLQGMVAGQPPQPAAHPQHQAWDTPVVVAAGTRDRAIKTPRTTGPLTSPPPTGGLSPREQYLIEQAEAFAATAEEDAAAVFEMRRRLDEQEHTLLDARAALAAMQACLSEAQAAHAVCTPHDEVQRLRRQEDALRDARVVLEELAGRLDLAERAVADRDRVIDGLRDEHAKMKRDAVVTLKRITNLKTQYEKRFVRVARERDVARSAAERLGQTTKMLRAKSEQRLQQVLEASDARIALLEQHIAGLNEELEALRRGQGEAPPATPTHARATCGNDVDQDDLDSAITDQALPPTEMSSDGSSTRVPRAATLDSSHAHAGHLPPPDGAARSAEGGAHPSEDGRRSSPLPLHDPRIPAYHTLLQAVADLHGGVVGGDPPADADAAAAAAAPVDDESERLTRAIQMLADVYDAYLEQQQQQQQATAAPTDVRTPHSGGDSGSVFFSPRPSATRNPTGDGAGGGIAVAGALESGSFHGGGLEGGGSTSLVGTGHVIDEQGVLKTTSHSLRGRSRNTMVTRDPSGRLVAGDAGDAGPVVDAAGAAQEYTTDGEVEPSPTEASSVRPVVFPASLHTQDSTGQQHHHPNAAGDAGGDESAARLVTTVAAASPDRSLVSGGVSSVTFGGVWRGAQLSSGRGTPAAACDAVVQTSPQQTPATANGGPRSRQQHAEGTPPATPTALLHVLHALRACVLEVLGDSNGSAWTDAAVDAEAPTMTATTEATAGVTGQGYTDTVSMAETGSTSAAAAAVPPRPAGAQGVMRYANGTPRWGAVLAAACARPRSAAPDVATREALDAMMAGVHAGSYDDALAVVADAAAALNERHRSEREARAPFLLRPVGAATAGEDIADFVERFKGGTRGGSTSSSSRDWLPSPRLLEGFDAADRGETPACDVRSDADVGVALPSPRRLHGYRGVEERRVPTPAEPGALRTGTPSDWSESVPSTVSPRSSLVAVTRTSTQQARPRAGCVSGRQESPTPPEALLTVDAPPPVGSTLPRASLALSTAEARVVDGIVRAIADAVAAHRARAAAHARQWREAQATLAEAAPPREALEKLGVKPATLLSLGDAAIRDIQRSLALGVLGALGADDSAVRAVEASTHPGVGSAAAPPPEPAPSPPPPHLAVQLATLRDEIAALRHVCGAAGAVTVGADDQVSMRAGTAADGSELSMASTSFNIHASESPARFAGGIGGAAAGLPPLPPGRQHVGVSHPHAHAHPLPPLSDAGSVSEYPVANGITRQDSGHLSVLSKPATQLSMASGAASASTRRGGDVYGSTVSLPGARDRDLASREGSQQLSMASTRDRDALFARGASQEALSMASAAEQPPHGSAYPHPHITRQVSMASDDAASVSVSAFSATVPGGATYIAQHMTPLRAQLAELEAVVGVGVGVGAKDGLKDAHTGHHATHPRGCVELAAVQQQQQQRAVHLALCDGFERLEERVERMIAGCLRGGAAMAAPQPAHLDASWAEPMSSTCTRLRRALDAMEAQHAAEMAAVQDEVAAAATVADATGLVFPRDAAVREAVALAARHRAAREALAEEIARLRGGRGEDLHPQRSPTPAPRCLADPDAAAAVSSPPRAHPPLGTHDTIKWHPFAASPAAAEHRASGGRGFPTSPTARATPAGEVRCTPAATPAGRSSRDHTVAILATRTPPPVPARAMPDTSNVDYTPTSPAGVGIPLPSTPVAAAGCTSTSASAVPLPSQTASTVVSMVSSTGKPPPQPAAAAAVLWSVAGPPSSSAAMTAASGVAGAPPASAAVCAAPLVSVNDSATAGTSIVWVAHNTAAMPSLTATTTNSVPPSSGTAVSASASTSAPTAAEELHDDTPTVLRRLVSIVAPVAAARPRPDGVCASTSAATASASTASASTAPRDGGADRSGAWLIAQVEALVQEHNEHLEMASDQSALDPFDEPAAVGAEAREAMEALLALTAMLEKMDGERERGLDTATTVAIAMPTHAWAGGAAPSAVASSTSVAGRAECEHQVPSSSSSSSSSRGTAAWVVKRVSRLQHECRRLLDERDAHSTAREVAEGVLREVQGVVDGHMHHDAAGSEGGAAVPSTAALVPAVNAILRDNDALGGDLRELVEGLERVLGGDGEDVSPAATTTTATLIARLEAAMAARDTARAELATLVERLTSVMGVDEGTAGGDDPLINATATVADAHASHTAATRPVVARAETVMRELAAASSTAEAEGRRIYGYLQNLERVLPAGESMETHAGDGADSRAGAVDAVVHDRMAAVVHRATVLSTRCAAAEALVGELGKLFSCDAAGGDGDASNAPCSTVATPAAQSGENPPPSPPSSHTQLRSSAEDLVRRSHVFDNVAAAVASAMHDTGLDHAPRDGADDVRSGVAALAAAARDGAAVAEQLRGLLVHIGDAGASADATSDSDAGAGTAPVAEKVADLAAAQATVDALVEHAEYAHAARAALLAVGQHARGAVAYAGQRAAYGLGTPAPGTEAAEVIAALDELSALAAAHRTEADTLWGALHAVAECVDAAPSPLPAAAPRDLDEIAAVVDAAVNRIAEASRGRADGARAAAAGIADVVAALSRAAARAGRRAKGVGVEVCSVGVGGGDSNGQADTRSSPGAAVADDDALSTAHGDVDMLMAAVDALVEKVGALEGQVTESATASDELAKAAAHAAAAAATSAATGALTRPSQHARIVVTAVDELVGQRDDALARLRDVDGALASTAEHAAAAAHHCEIAQRDADGSTTPLDPPCIPNSVQARARCITSSVDSIARAFEDEARRRVSVAAALNDAAVTAWKHTPRGGDSSDAAVPSTTAIVGVQSRAITECIEALAQQHRQQQQQQAAVDEKTESASAAAAAAAAASVPLPSIFAILNSCISDGVRCVTVVGDDTTEAAAYAAGGVALVRRMTEMYGEYVEECARVVEAAWCARACDASKETARCRLETFDAMDREREAVVQYCGASEAMRAMAAASAAATHKFLAQHVLDTTARPAASPASMPIPVVGVVSTLPPEVAVAARTATSITPAQSRVVSPVRVRAVQLPPPTPVALPHAAPPSV